MIQNKHLSHLLHTFSRTVQHGICSEYSQYRFGVTDSRVLMVERTATSWQ